MNRPYGRKEGMELKRILSYKNMIILLAAVVTNLVLFTYEAASGWNFADSAAEAGKYEAAMAEFEGMSYEEITEHIKKDKLATQDIVYKNIGTHLAYITGYKKNIQNVINRAQMLQGNVLFSDKNSFSYNNIIKTEQDFQKLLNVEPILDNDYAVLKISDYYYCMPIAMLVVLVMIASLHGERENDMWKMVRAGAQGRFVLAVKRAGIVLFLTFIVLTGTYGSMTAAALLLFGGVGGLSAPIQNIEKFGQSAHLISKRGYLLLNFFWEYMAIAAVAALIYLLFTLFRNRKNVAIGIVFFLLVEYLFYTKIESQNVYGVLREVNVLNLFKMSDICMRYKNIGSHAMVVQIGTLLAAVLALTVLLSLAASVIIHAKMNPGKPCGPGTKILEKTGELYQKLFEKTPAFFKEVHKTVFTAKGIWLMAGVLITAAYFSSTDFVRFSDSESADDIMYLEHGGREYSYITEHVEAVEQRFESAKRECERMKALYEKGKATEMELSNAEGVAAYFNREFGGVSELREKLAYLKRLEDERGIRGYMMSDRGYYQALGGDGIKREAIIFTVMQIALFQIAASVMRLEKRTGMKPLIKSCQEGQKMAHIRKLTALACVSALVAFAAYAIDYVNLFSHYGTPYLEAPVQSLTFMEEIPFPVTIGQWIVLLVLMKAAMTSAVAAAGYMLVLFFERRKAF